jgi:cell division protein FtsX
MQIKDATGATASQMNSNVEMQAWLNSMTDPQQSIETVQETLKQLDSVIAGVRSQVEQEQAGKKSPAKSAPAAPAAPAKAGPSVSNW